VNAISPNPLLARLAAHARCAIENDRGVATGEDDRCVVYWMQRAQRGFDNPALDAAIFAANELSLPLAVFFAPVPFYPRANARAYRFLFEGVADLAKDVEARGAAFVYRTHPRHRITDFAAEVNAAFVVTDQNPLREIRDWRRSVASRLPVSLVSVDADVVVPTQLLEKDEWAAYTIRPKIHRLLPTWLTTKPEPAVAVRFSTRRRPRSEAMPTGVLAPAFARDTSALPAVRYRGGSAAGRKALDRFLAGGLAQYEEQRNRPECETGTSRISMYLHFGHLGPRYVATKVMESDAPESAKAAYLEQLIVRRELAVNFVTRNPHYDDFRCAPDWARATLAVRRSDPRPYTLSREQLELGDSPDPLWNAAQNEMRLTGFMHNHMRMYWAKKLLEWSPSPEEAFAIAVEWNDRYELDGRDPNSYAGIAWAIAGKHDRPFAPGRQVFGTIRPMTLASTRRKFDSRRYMETVAALATEVKQ
jgi:deoxyribodipyrimidine photo-lyase